MKKCSKCGVVSNNFGNNRKTWDELKSWCKDCMNNSSREYSRTRNGLVTKIYGHQRASSRYRGHAMPNYNLQELREWVFSQPNFEELYNKWVASGYNKELIPSCDRLDDYKPYTLDNMQIITFRENYIKATVDIKNGINNKRSKAVVGVHKETGEKIDFYSIKEASRRTKIQEVNIGYCCRGERIHAGEYKWRYKD